MESRQTREDRKGKINEHFMNNPIRTSSSRHRHKGAVSEANPSPLCVPTVEESVSRHYTEVLNLTQHPPLIIIP
ncbi:hypothetical protein J6590_104935 [Homalodisca vitripennis]|nr:hypothetical protein J6590_104935 [Homalodisca vitripennis]